MFRFGPRQEEPQVPGWVRSVAGVTQVVVTAGILATTGMVFQGLKDTDKLSTRLDGFVARFSECIELVKNNTFRIIEIEKRQERQDVIIEQLLRDRQ
jgi:hypothetical protein